MENFDWKSNWKVKTLRTDNGIEIYNIEFDNFCISNGIQRHKSIPYTS